MKIKKYSNLIFVILATFFLLVPVLLTNLKKDQISATENRRLAEPVPISEGLSAYMRGLNSCMNDRVGLRDKMVELYSNISVNILQSRNKQVLIGKDDWLFYTEDLPDYTGANNDPATVEYCVQIIKAIDEWCSSHGSQFVFMIGPNKSTVYYKYMPDYIKKAEVTLMDSLTARLEEEGILVVNPKEKLIADSDKRELYFKLDTHWNSYGAKYALDEMVEKLGLPVYDFPMAESKQKSGDLSTILTASPESIKGESLFVDVTPDPGTEVDVNLEAMRITYDNADGESYICFRDSFTSSLENFYTYYFDGPMYSNWYITQTPVEDFPDYFILECVERYIMNCMDKCSVIINSPEQFK